MRFYNDETLTNKTKLFNIVSTICIKNIRYDKVVNNSQLNEIRILI